MKCILKYPGSKWRIADWIISHFPKHHSYLEPFFGSGAVLFKKEPSNIETINDLDQNVTNLFRCIRESPDELARLVEATPYSRYDYNQAFVYEVPESDLEKARIFLIKCWQGHGYRVNQYKVGWKNDVQGRERAYAMRHWNELPERILLAADMLKQVVARNEPRRCLICGGRLEDGVFVGHKPDCELAALLGIVEGKRG